MVDKVTTRLAKEEGTVAKSSSVPPSIDPAAATLPPEETIRLFVALFLFR